MSADLRVAVGARAVSRDGFEQRLGQIVDLESGEWGEVATIAFEDREESTDPASSIRSDAKLGHSAKNKSASG